MGTRRLLLVLFAVFSALPVYAEGTNGDPINLRVKKSDDPKRRDEAPYLEVTIVDGQKVPVEKCSISTTVNQQKVTIKADQLRDYADGKETIAIALVINGQEIWIGNEEVEPDPNAQYVGVLKNLEAAIDRLQLGTAGPPGSKGIVVSYSTGAEIKVAMGQLDKITGGALGGQKDYRGKIGTDMVQGITMAMAELSKVTTDRKALIVVGDGCDTNPEEAKRALPQLKKELGKQNVQLFAIIYKSAVSCEANVITTMIPTAKTVNSIDGIASELNAILARMANRYYLRFPGFDDKQGVGLPWDGRDHDLVIHIDQADLEPITVTLVPKWGQPKHSGVPWLLNILLLVGFICLILIFKAIFGRKPAPQPVVMQAAAPLAEAPKPAGPMKTVMIGAGGDHDGFPIVGWLVPLNGVDAYKTWRLKPGLTKIGTAPPADVVVNDGFMSTEHCQITSSPAGFTLHDNGSTNGTYVNDRKVQKQDLVDNDMIMVGKTTMKFKSIN
jgi:hypothetical protein